MTIHGKSGVGYLQRVAPFSFFFLPFLLQAPPSVIRPPIHRDEGRDRCVPRARHDTAADVPPGAQSRCLLLITEL